MDKVMDLIQKAQYLIGDACQLMCPITPLCEDWEKLGKVYDVIHAEWHRLNLVRNGNHYDLDGDEKARFEAKQKELTKA